jgi:hypothetical protein
MVFAPQTILIIEFKSSIASFFIDYQTICKDILLWNSLVGVSKMNAKQDNKMPIAKATQKQHLAIDTQSLY